MEKNEKIYVIADTWRTFHSFRNKLIEGMHLNDISVGVRDIVYISCPQTLYGLSGDIWGYRVGQYTKRQDYVELCETMRSRMMDIDNFVEVEEF